MTGVGYLWGLRRKTMRVLAGYRMWIVGGGNRDLMRADLGYRKVFGYAHREVDTVVAAAGMVVVDRRMKMVEAHFEVDTAALGCENLSW